VKKEPFYNFNEFVKACSEKQNVTLIEKTREDAKKDFNLQPFEAILDFISNGGLEELKFETNKPYEKYPELTVDSYEFKTCGKLGYIAISKNKKGKWLIKSFHLSNKSNSPFKELFDNMKENENLGKIIGGKG
jgi:hypothetical protein